MGQTLVIHDTRLRGNYVFGGADHVFRVNQWTSLQWSFSRIRNYALAHGKLDRLLIACHGYEDIVEDRVGLRSVQVGGFGLELCLEGLTLNNVGQTRTLRDHVDSIVVYACSAAETYPRLIGRDGDGSRLMGEIAIRTNAVVYAADATQFSQPQGNNQLNLGRWHGNLYQYNPNGRPPRLLETHSLSSNLQE